MLIEEVMIAVLMPLNRFSVRNMKTGSYGRLRHFCRGTDSRLACAAGAEKGRGQGRREKGRGIGERERGLPSLFPSPFPLPFLRLPRRLTLKPSTSIFMGIIRLACWQRRANRSKPDCTKIIFLHRYSFYHTENIHQHKTLCNIYELKVLECRGSLKA